MAIYDANIGNPEALPAQSPEMMGQASLMEQATIPAIPTIEPFFDSGLPETIVADGYVGPGSETYAIHAKLGGQAAAEEIVELNRQETDTFEADSAESDPGFMSKLSGFIGEHPGLTFGVALGAVGTFGAVTAETAHAAPVGSEVPAAKVGSPTAGAKSTEASASTAPCEDSVESDCSYEPPAGSEDQPSQPENPGQNGGNENGGGGKHEGKNKGRDDNLLPVPKHKTARYYATKLINELRKGKDGRISASPSAHHDIDLARKGKCAPIDKIPGACVKIKKSLLETLYKASLIMRFKVNYLTGADHVTCSDHWMGRGADLMRFNGKAPGTKKLLGVFSRVLRRNGESAQLLGPGDEGHSGSAAHWHIGINGPNTICQ